MARSLVLPAERVIGAFDAATHADVEEVSLQTDSNGDLWVERQGSVPYEFVDVTSWARVA